MAIVEMKHMNLLAVRQDQSRILRAMQKLGCVEVAPVEDEALAAYASGDTQTLNRMDERLKRLDEVIHQLGAYNPQKAPFMGNLPEASQEDIDWVTAHPEALQSVIDQAEALDQRAGEYRGQLARLQNANEQLDMWISLDIPVEDIRATRLTSQWAGTVDARGLENLKAALEPLAAHMDVVSIVRETACVWVIAYAGAVEEAQAALREASYVPARFPYDHGSPAHQRQLLDERIQETLKAQEGLTEEWKALSQHLTRMKVWYDTLQIERDRERAAQRTIGTASAFMLTGWVPAERAEQVCAKLKEISPTCSIELRDPTEEEEPPVALKNGRLSTPFESIVEGFALPAYRGFDPTPVMAPFYALLFGMMFSDAGYGLVMAIAIPLLIRIKQPGKGSRKLLWVLFFSALATIFAGVLYDTWFGFNPVQSLLGYKPSLILNPIVEPMTTMIVCMGLGVVHLFAGLGCGMYMNIRRGKPMDAVFDQLSWMLVVAGLIMLVVGGTVGEIGKWLAIAGVALILLFAGREKKNPLKRLMSGLGALYGATSWISDILSYIRLFGMGLATGVIGMVINMLVGMVVSSGVIGMVIGAVLFVGAHAFNLGINALGAYVHSCRLQYIEFFGKFYEEGGVPFRPLQCATRYTRITEV